MIPGLLSVQYCYSQPFKHSGREKSVRTWSEILFFRFFFPHPIGFFYYCWRDTFLSAEFLFFLISQYSWKIIVIFFRHNNLSWPSFQGYRLKLYSHIGSGGGGVGNCWWDPTLLTHMYYVFLVTWFSVWTYEVLGDDRHGSNVWYWFAQDKSRWQSTWFNHSRKRQVQWIRRSMQLVLGLSRVYHWRASHSFCQVLCPT